MPKQPEQKRYLHIKGETLYDAAGKVIASDGDELEEGILSEECVAWLLADGKGEWVEPAVASENGWTEGE